MKSFISNPNTQLYTKQIYVQFLSVLLNYTAEKLGKCNTEICAVFSSQLLYFYRAQCVIEANF